jgi:hypothetical protein
VVFVFDIETHIRILGFSGSINIEQAPEKLHRDLFIDCPHYGTVIRGPGPHITSCAIAASHLESHGNPFGVDMAPVGMKLHHQ